MALIDSIDYPNKRIYLSATTVATSIDTLDIYREVRALRVSTAAHRNFKTMIVSGGNEQKTATTFTPKFVKLLYGCRIVPYDTSHTLTITRETFTDDNFAGVEVFDLSPLTGGVAVNILIDVPQVEVVVITTGGSSLLPDERTQLFSLDTLTNVKPSIGI